MRLKMRTKLDMEGSPRMEAPERKRDDVETEKTLQARK
jgi:hypothetical protein